ncbi:hypothetical protein PpBr36_07238 [Pyricularia pennisetigena]|uniref:hypothetical protein n=1 Tax=Pyricularia pennisetigena TaxID=1578925 RepID=UPI00114FED92|nr:hypothetical protein PpBr36_07238 [Pyricularia pennisetigena]TLS25991.1 hypothetical protein PpBr36_07238 [Pyricularia pennisetigena]
MKSCRGLAAIAKSTLWHSNPSTTFPFWTRSSVRHVKPPGGFGVAVGRNSSARQIATAHPGWSAAPLPSAPDVANRVKAVLRRMPQSVVVITAAGISPAEGRGSAMSAKQDVEPVGMTVSSFASLDLDGDVAAVAFNVKRPSRTLDAIARGGGAFNVHVLAGTDAGARVAHHFTRPNGANSYEVEDGELEPSKPRAALGLFDELQRRTGCVAISTDSGHRDQASPPMLQGPGVLYILKCALSESSERILLPIMNHTIVVAGVTDVVAGELPLKEDEQGVGSLVATHTTLGLTYGDRQYRSPGSVILNGNGSAPKPSKS